MGSHFISTVVSGLFLLSTTLLVEARRGLNPDELHLLTRGTDYTFHSICADFKNPDLFFDEWELARTIQAITNDLNMYMWGSSTGASKPDPHTLPVDPGERKWPIGRPEGIRFMPHGQDVVDGAGRPVGGLEKGGRGRAVDCKKFQRELKDAGFATSFQKMVYAISEKCYRQCEPNGYVAYAASNLQTTFEAHYNGGFYRQVREIEAETGCRFPDIFLVDTERAIDYSKIWIETYQRHERPCAKLR